MELKQNVGNKISQPLGLSVSLFYLFYIFIEFSRYLCQTKAVFVCCVCYFALYIGFNRMQNMCLHTTVFDLFHFCCILFCMCSVALWRIIHQKHEWYKIKANKLFHFLSDLRVSVFLIGAFFLMANFFCHSASRILLYILWNT